MNRKFARKTKEKKNNKKKIIKRKEQQKFKKYKNFYE
jgi:hypothetical protein